MTYNAVNRHIAVKSHKDTKLFTNLPLIKEYFEMFLTLFLFQNRVADVILKIFSNFVNN